MVVSTLLPQWHTLIKQKPPPDAEELAELGQGLALEQRSLVFLPVNDAEEFFRGGTHW